MSNKEIILKALEDHKLEMVETPLGNEFILDEKWLVELDYDGAFAATIFCLPKTNKQKLVVFSKRQDDMEKILLDIKEKVINAIGEIQVA